MKNRGLYIFILISAIFFLSGFGIAQATGKKMGVREFVDFLKKNKEILNYESFGSFEHEDQVEVRIYCNDESRKKIEENIYSYKYISANYKDNLGSTGVLYVLFEKKSVSKSKNADELSNKKIKCPRKVNVKTGTVKTGDVKEYKKFKGLLKDGGKAAVVSPVSGTVSSVMFKSGDKIEKGDVILRFDTSDIDRLLNDARTSLRDWKTKLKKRRGWKVRSPRAEKQAERKVSEFDARISDLMEKKRNSALSSNVSGQILSIITNGSKINAGDEIAVVLDNSVMKMEISSEDITVFEGLENAKIEIEGKGEFEGELKREGSNIFVLINNEGFKLTASDKASFTVLSKVYKDVPVLDNSLLLKDDGGKYVYTIEKKRAKKIYIKTGVTDGKKVVIVSGAVAGDIIILTKNVCLKDGKKIKVIEGIIPVKKSKKKVKKHKVKKPKAKKQEKPIEKKVAKKVYKQKPVQIISKIKFVGKKKNSEWGEFDNCPSVVKVMTRKLVKGSIYAGEEYKSHVESGVADIERSGISGKIANVYQSAGSMIQKGELLLEFDVNDLEQKKIEKQRQLDQWKKVLSDVEVWSDRNLQLENEVKDKIRIISKQLRMIHGTINDSKLYAKASGTLTFIVKSGDDVKSGDVLAKLVEKSRVRIPVEFKGKLKKISNLKVEVTFEGIKGKYSGKLVESNGIREVIVEDSYNQITIGMKAVVRVFGNFENRIILSNNELLRDSKGYFAFISKGKKAEKRYLKILSFGEKGVAVASGLKENEDLIVNNLLCLDNNKKIKIYTYDSHSGRKVFIGKKSPTDIKREKIAKKRFAVGAGGSYLMVSDDIFKNVYGSGNFSAMFTLSYRVSKKLEILFDTLYLAKTGSTLSVSKVNLSMFEFNLGLRYLFGRSEKMLPFVGIALNSLAVKEKSDEINLNTKYKTSTGGTVLAGVYYEITPGLDFLIDVRYDLNKMKVGAELEDIDFSGVRALIGIIFRF